MREDVAPVELPGNEIHFESLETPSPVAETTDASFPETSGRRVAPPVENELERRIAEMEKKISQLLSVSSSAPPLTYMEIFVYFVTGIFMIFLLDLFFHFSLRFHKG